MRKYTLLILLFMACMFDANGQLVVKFNGGSGGDPGSTIEVDVTVSNFTQLFGIQYSINWDSLVLSYKSIKNVTENLPGFDIGAIGVPPGSVNIKPGQITVSWFQSETKSLPNDTRLFTMEFDALSVPCDSTFIEVTDFPLEIEITDANFNNIGVSFTPKLIKINGTDCGGGSGGDTNLTFTFDNKMVQPSSNVCFPLKVKNFNGFNGGQGKFSWDPAVLAFDKIQNKTGGSFNDNTNNTSTGTYNFLWENLTPGTPVTLPDGTTFFEICFNVVGSPGDMTTIDLVSFTGDWGFVDAAGDEPPITLNNGKITIVDIIPDPVTFTINDITINEGDSGCVSVTASNFENVLSMQGTFTWNSTVTTFKNTQDFGAVNGLKAGDFNPIDNNKLRLTWMAPSGVPDGVTIADGTEIFKICFDGVGPCPAGGTTLIDFVEQPDFAIEITVSAGGAPFEVDYVVNSGTVTVNCESNPISCSLVSQTNVLCNGQSTGGAVVSVINATAGCECIWYKDGSTTPFATTTAPNCNLVNAGAGVYKLDVVCGGEVKCSTTVTISQSNAIVINGAVTNAGCGQTTGSVVLSVSGGTPDFTYLWNDVNATKTKDLPNVPPGTYSVIVTDKNNCTASREFEVKNTTDPLTVTEVVTDVKCFGDNDGSIVLTIAGGCAGYTVSPTTLTGLAPGTYSVTVADSSTPPFTWTKDIEITGPAAALDLSGTTTPASGGNNNGAISTTISGGTMAYAITWTGGIPANVFNPTNLAPGSYTGTVMDANGCITSETFIVDSPSSAPVVNGVEGVQVSCNGLVDGSVSGRIVSGTAPFKVDVLNGTSVVKTINVATATTFTVTGISAGAYVLKVTGAQGAFTDIPFTITQPAPISFTSTANCANGASPDGSINISVSGGSGSFEYEWNTGASTEDLENVGIGNYSVLIEDGNGCQAIINNIRIFDCDPTNCYEAIKIITPNGDGVNDAFIINCVMQEQTRLTLYDRWGRQVFTQRNYDNSWKGVNQTGEELIEGGYMWVLEVDFTDSRREVFKGTVTILTQN